MSDDIFSLIIAALAALVVGIVDTLLFSIGLKTDAAVPSASDAWYD